MRLINKTAVVTGSAKGIGKAVAFELAREGAKIVVLDIAVKESKEVVELLKHAGTTAEFIKCDVTKKKDVKRAIDKVINTHGIIDILVNSAGLFVQKNLEDINEKDWDDVIDTNLKGVFLCVKEVSKYMKRFKRGKIISLASIAGEVGFKDASSYSAANAGIINLTKDFALELSPHRINVNAVSPGIIATEMTEKMLNDPEKKKELLSNIPMYRIGSVEEVADAVIFLATKDSDFITGHNLVVDGGWLTH